jgi:hypothetical protein
LPSRQTWPASHREPAHALCASALILSGGFLEALGDLLAQVKRLHNLYLLSPAQDPTDDLKPPTGAKPQDETAICLGFEVL